MNPGISVIICCYNSEHKIAPTLQHLAAQILAPELSWEILLVDNCCTDNTVAFALSEWEGMTAVSKPPLRIIKEPSPGLSWARRAGLNAAQYDTLCFCDDDNWLDKHYLSLAYNIMNNNPEIGILAGQGIPASDIQFPDWFHQYQALYACGKLADKTGDITSNKWAWGAGMVLRTETLKRLYEAGFSHLNDDRKGDNLSSGGDTEICYWHILIGKKIWFDKNLIFTHFISPERISKSYAEELNSQLDLSYNNLSPYFPLIFDDKYKNTPKMILLLKAIMAMIRRQDGSPFFVHLQPVFNFRFPRQTQAILQNLKNYKANLKSK